MIIWMTGLPGSGKTTLANRLKDYASVAVLDGDEIRKTLCEGLGFTDEDRTENIRRVAETACIISKISGLVIHPVISLITPLDSQRNLARSIARLRGVDFKLVYVKCSLETCIYRDPKGMYREAREGKRPGFTGIDGKFDDIVVSADVTVQTDKSSILDCADHIMKHTINSRK